MSVARKAGSASAPEVLTYYCAEKDAMRRDTMAEEQQQPLTGKSPRATSKFNLHKLVQTALGNVKVDRSGKQLYYTGKDCIKVRRTMAVDGLVSDLDDRQVIFDRTLARHVDAVVTQSRDVVVLLSGNSGTSKSQLLHGDTLDPQDSGDVVPPRPKWGLALFAVERLLAAAAVRVNEPIEIAVTATKINVDHVADVLVSLQGLRLSKTDAQKTRQQYAKLLTLSKGVTLDVEESADGSFAVADQLDTPLHSVDDFLHVVNCFAAINAGRSTFMRLGKKNASPFHFVITIRVWRREQNPSYIQLVEMADSDWTGGSEDETLAFRQCFDAVCDVSAALAKKDVVEAKDCLRRTTFTRIVHSPLSLPNTTVVHYGLTHFSTGLEMMGFLSRCSCSPITIVLHGPDGEGEDDVDPELRHHVLEVQNNCEDLRAEVARLKTEKITLTERLKSGEETVSKLQQQCNIVRKMTMSQAPRPDTAKAAAVAPVGPSPLELQRRRLASLEQDLKVLEEEDNRRAEASRRQIQFMADERARCATKTQALQKEHDQLKARLAELESSISKDRQAREADMQAKIGETIDQTRSEVERYNRAQRLAVQQSMQRAAQQQERDILREEVVAAELHRTSTNLNELITKENASWAVEQDTLQKEYEGLCAQRGALETELEAVSFEHKRQTELLDEETKAMSQYVHELSAAIVRFECHNSSEIKRILTFPKCNVVLYDPTLKHTPEWFEKQCMVIRAWLDARGYPRPLAYCDVENGVIELLDPVQSLEPPKVEKKSVAVATAPVEEPRPEKDLTKDLCEKLTHQNHSLRIALEARQRLEALHASKGQPANVSQSGVGRSN